MSCVFIYLHKNNFMKKKILYSLLIFVLLNACKKEEIDTQQTSPPTITINDPKELSYNLGDTVSIDVIVNDQPEMHDAEWFLILNPQNDTLWNQRIHSHDTEIIFNTYYVLGTFLDQQNVDFIVKAENAFGDKHTEMHSFVVLNP